MTRRLIISVALTLFAAASLFAQAGAPKRHGHGYFNVRSEIIDGDTVQVYDLTFVPVFARKADMRKHERLIRNVKKVYPIALEAERRLAKAEEELMQMQRKGAQKNYIAKMERELVKEYTPVLKKMTFSQGKILIKLIDRQTEKTTYDIVRELRGGLSAGIWQGVAKLFDADLKQNYDADGEDKVIEQIIIMYEAGLL